ncbi:hypothetical protein ACIA8G_03295 [Lentzea sp. NPDC051213]|uniref:hypothetical protein n=1 Tax=Lentzea sp. NPDC051213 TaxID=3364126 RepID=UPI0037BC0EF5
MISSRLVVGLLSMWLFGNLYEQIVWNPQLLADPRPGTLVGTFAAGSPVYYYLPWAPLGVALAVVTRVRLPRTAPGRVLRAWNVALGCLAVALAMKILLITQVNPLFRDPAASREQVHDHAVLWAFGNGITVVTVAAALLLITGRARGAAPD